MRGEFRVQGYDIDALVSAGATGEVWLARRHGSGAPVALKRLSPRDQAARDEVRRLVSLVDILGHPHLLRIQDSLPFGDELVLVLDHADGGSLDQLLNGRGALDPGEVVTAVAPVAEALAAAHERGLVHGDVTPEHILFTADGRPLLADLGLLGLIDGGEALGTLGYADPSAGPAGRTPAGDVFGLAAVCYTALTGIPPRPGQPRPPLPEAVPDVPQGLAHAVAVGLQPVAARRPTAAQFADLLYGACPPAPVRFPIGLVLSDADVAAAIAASRDTPKQTPPAGHTDRESPSAGNQPGPGATTSAGAGAAADPLASPSAQRVPVGPRVVEAADADVDDDEPRRRVGLIIAVVAAIVVVAGGVVGGVVWAGRSRPEPPPVASDDASPEDTRSPRPSGTPTSGQERGPSTPPATATPSAPSRTTSPPRPPAPDAQEARWRGVLADLDQRRAQAFAASDPTLLGTVYAPGSDLVAKDTAQIEKCVPSGCHLEGLRFAVRTLDVVSEGRNQTVLRVVDQLQAYTVVSADGERVSQPAGEPKTREITLARAGTGGWLISRIDER
ncbi:serine/threonine protein kinase [Actinopolymorpha pittospori]